MSERGAYFKVPTKTMRPDEVQLHTINGAEEEEDGADETDGFGRRRPVIVAPERAESTFWSVLKGSALDFCGLTGAAEDQDKWKTRYDSLAEAYVIKDPEVQPGDDVQIRAGVAPGEVEQDQVDGLLTSLQRRHFHGQVRIPVSQSSRRATRGRPRYRHEKPLLMKLAYDSIKEALGPPKKSIEKKPRPHSRSFAPSDVRKYGWKSPSEVPKMPSADVDMVDGYEDMVDAGIEFLEDSFFNSGSSTAFDTVDFGGEALPFDEGEPVVEGEAAAVAPPDGDFDEPDRMERRLPTVEDDKYWPSSRRYRWDGSRGEWIFREPRTTQRKTRVQMEAEAEQEGIIPAMQRISQKVKSQLFDNSDRIDAARNCFVVWLDKGIFGKCFNVRFDKYYKYKWQGDQYIPNKSTDHRPGFTLWLTFVQIILCITSLAVYGVAPWGVETQTVSQLIIKPNLALELESYLEYENMWVGPRQADLIHLGAKYSPCMRRDENIEVGISLDRARESATACCINNDGSGCVQTVKNKCSGILSSWENWHGANAVMKDILRTSGSVCGQDPEFCIDPPSTSPFNWPDDITKWPICREGVFPNASSENPHMACEVVGRPCCAGIQGECLITTRDHCTFLRGYFHEEATLCAQVDCINEVCGMLPFGDPEVPDQFYRLWTTLFLHAGVLQLLLSLVFNFFIIWPVERMVGWIRVSVIFCFSGIAGSLASSIFVPYHVGAGPAGGQFGVIASYLVMIILFMNKPKTAILRMVALIVGLIVLGLLPMIDNYANVFGFIFGFLVSFAILPFARFGKRGTSDVNTGRIIAITVCSLLVVGLTAVLIILFYVAPIYECPYCHYFNCIPITARFCDQMEVKIRTTSSY